MGGVDVSTWVSVGLTVCAFGAGLLVGYLWWGKQFVRARLTRNEALSLMQGHIERELDAKDAEIRRLRRVVDGEAGSDGA